MNEFEKTYDFSNDLCSRGNYTNGFTEKELKEAQLIQRTQEMKKLKQKNLESNEDLFVYTFFV